MCAISVCSTNSQLVYNRGLLNNFPSLTPQLESLLQLWLTLSLNTCPGGSEDSGSDIFLFNASRVPTIPLSQGQDPFTASFLLSTPVIRSWRSPVG